MTADEKVAELEMEDGLARAELHKRIGQLAKARGTTWDGVYAGIRKTQLWQRIGSPDPKHITAAQVGQLLPLVDRQIAKAQAGDIPSRHHVSKAPVPPWAKTEEGVDGEVVTP